jgi:hypothetical protein
MWRNCRPSIIQNANRYGPAFFCFQLNNRTSNYEGTEFIFSRGTESRNLPNKYPIYQILSTKNSCDIILIKLGFFRLTCSTPCEVEKTLSWVSSRIRLIVWSNPFRVPGPVKIYVFIFLYFISQALETLDRNSERARKTRHVSTWLP